MKIISLRFANLNSLPGPYLIRFDTAPLADTGLFAITGPTGAGKSTLLDAIAVGLYGRVPRHDRQVGEMVSRHAPHAWSEVEFEVQQPDSATGQPARARYRARWEVRRKTKGKDAGGLNQDAMSLTDCASGRLLLSGKELVPVRVGELSGLDFGQFEQAVLLSQGKFARFLHAREAERSALLEKMTNVGIYSQLGAAAFERAKEEEQATRLLEATLHATRLLPPAERQQLERQLAELDAEAELIWEHQRELSDQLAWRILLDQLERQAAGAAAEAAALAAAGPALRPGFERLAAHERAQPLRPALEAVEQARQELTYDTAELTRLRQQLPALALAAEAAAQALAAAEATAAQAAAEAERLRPVLQEAERQDAAIAAATAQLGRRQHEHATRHHAHATAHAAWQQLTARVADLNRQQAALEKWLLLHNHENALGDELRELKRDLLDLEEVATGLARLETAQTQLLRQHEAAATERQRYQQAADEAGRQAAALHGRAQPVRAAYEALLAGQPATYHTQAAADHLAHLHLLERLLPLAETAERHAQMAAALTQEYAAEATAITEAEAARTALAERHDTAAELLASLEETLRIQQTLADLNAHRQQLRPGEACPLCGALEHPLGAGYQPQADGQQRRVAAQRTALAALAAELRQLDLTLERCRTEQHQRQQRRHEATQAAAATRRQAEALAPGAPVDPEALRAALPAAEAAYQAANAACARLAGLRQQLDALLAEHEAARRQADSAAARATEATHRQQLLAQELAGQKASLAERRDQAANYRHEAQAKLRPHQLGLPAAAPFAGLLATLAERAATFEQQRQALDRARHDHTHHNAAHAAQAAELAREQAALAAAAAALAADEQALAAQRAARLAHHPGPDPAAEREALHQAAQRLAQAWREADHAHAARHQARREAEAAHAQRQADHARHQQQLAAAEAGLRAAGFAGAAEAQALLLPPAEAETLRLRREQHQASLLASGQLRERLSFDLYRHQEASPTLLSTAALTQELKQLNAENEQLHQRLGSLGGQLAHDDQARQQQAEGQAQLRLRQLEQQRWQDLAEQIGSAKGDKFSRFAQGLTLGHLARLANLRLRQLTGRYTIQKTPGHDLELQIIDHDQADTVRPMASLSGGESFLVSLALALGLSELAGHQARIESLFIDEGFGTLDAEALNTALDALERLQHSGKMIGVISHVADLKERIGTQIRVQPVAGGNSTIRLVDGRGREQDCNG